MYCLLELVYLGELFSVEVKLNKGGKYVNIIILLWVLWINGKWCGVDKIVR